MRNRVALILVLFFCLSVDNQIILADKTAHDAIDALDQALKDTQKTQDKSIHTTKKPNNNPKNDSDCDNEIANVRKKAESGDAHAQFLLGYYYEVGKYISKDMNEAAKWYRISANSGDSDAQWCLGIFYEEGYLGKKNFDEAMRLYTLSANQGNSSGQCILGLMLAIGEITTKDTCTAYYWLYRSQNSGTVYENKSCAEGLKSVEAQLGPKRAAQCRERQP